jgi:autoinducer 2-degrading protein
MIKRIVLMKIKPEAEALFLDIFEDAKNEIRSRPGCMGIELLRSSNDAEIILWTLSSWHTIDDLESYRASTLFQTTWSNVKPLFSDKALAWTLTPIETLT